VRAITKESDGISLAMKPKKAGILFALAALLLGLAAYAYRYTLHETPPGGEFWIYAGFALPLLGGILGQALAGCNFKVGGCAPALYAGIVAGFFLLSGLYFCLGFALGKLWQWWKK
jgi:hypothetical protein